MGPRKSAEPEGFLGRLQRHFFFTALTTRIPPQQLYNDLKYRSLSADRHPNLKNKIRALYTGKTWLSEKEGVQLRPCKPLPARGVELAPVFSRFGPRVQLKRVLQAPLKSLHVLKVDRFLRELVVAGDQTEQ